MPTTYTYDGRPGDYDVAFECGDLTVRWSELDAEQKARINAMINATASGRYDAAPVES